MGSFKTSKVTVAAAVLVLSALPLDAVRSADATTTFAVDIDSQPLEAALVELSKQGRMQLVISTGSLPARISTPLHGSMPLGVALDALLKDTGLTYKFVGNNTIAIVKPVGQTSQLSEPPAPGTSGDIRSAQPSTDPNVDGGSNNNPSRGVNSVKRNRIFSRIATFLGFCVSASLSGTACAQNADAANTTKVAELEEIVVTAQRVQSLASKTPISLSAISGEDLLKKGVTDPLSLGDEVPNLSIVANNGLQISIRGVSSNDNTEKGDSSAAFLLDGVYIARPQAQEVSFFDVERVEVLRGPQGTLYGRNTTAGVVNVIPSRPTDKFDVAANAGFGNFGATRADAMVNLPVNDVLAVRFSSAYDRQDSFIVAEPGEIYSFDPAKDNLSGRAQALIAINEDVSLLLRTDYSRIQGNAQGVRDVIGTRFYAPLPACVPSYTDRGYIADRYSENELRRIGFAQAARPSVDIDTWGFDAELNWNFGPLTMTYLGSHRDFDRDSVTTRTATTTLNTFDGDFKQDSHELRLATNSHESLQMQFGTYYFSEKSHILQIGGIVNAFDQNTEASNIGVFGQATYSATDDLRFTLGGRYSEDDKKRVGITYRPVTLQLISPNDAEANSSKFTWRAAVDYDLTDASFLYGVVSTGYKGGGFNDGCEAGTPNCSSPSSSAALYYDPETLTAYEVGLKTRFFDGTLGLNAAVFYNDYKNLQVSSPIEVNGANQLFTTNAANASIKGVELDAVYALDRRNRFDASLSYLDAVYDNYWPFGVGTAPNFAGRALDRSPEYVVTFGYAYTQPLVNDASLTFSLKSRYSKEYFIISQTVGSQFEQPSFTKTDASIRYESAGGHYSVQAYARNLENDIQVTNARVAAGRVLVTPSDPRTYGIRFGYRY